MTVPKGWRDSRATNQLHIDPKHIDAMREVRMPFADYAELLARANRASANEVEEREEVGTGRQHRRRKAAATVTNGWDWNDQHVYVRHKMPSDHRGDTLGPALHGLFAADFPSPAVSSLPDHGGGSGQHGNAGELKGVMQIGVDGSLAVHDTKIRSGSAGLYYPAHSDCYHNMLLVVQGRRRVRLVDQSAVWRRSIRGTGDSVDFRAMLRLKSLDNTSVVNTLGRMVRGRSAQTQAPRAADQRASQEANSAPSAALLVVWETVLESGEALYIPPTWLHDVHYIESGMGINQFYYSPQTQHQEEEAVLNGVQAEVQLCKYLKARLDASRGDAAAASATAKAVEQELGEEVGHMLAQVDALIDQHRSLDLEKGPTIASAEEL